MAGQVEEGGSSNQKEGPTQAGIGAEAKEGAEVWDFVAHVPRLVPMQPATDGLASLCCLLVLEGLHWQQMQARVEVEVQMEVQAQVHVQQVWVRRKGELVLSWGIYC
jgi:ribosome biogenesis SPOUT family RNA methylase Rps3